MGATLIPTTDTCPLSENKLDLGGKFTLCSGMFDVGDKVVCINDEFPDWVVDLYNDLPKKDEVYVVRDIVMGQNYDLSMNVTVLLVGILGNINQHGVENGFNPNRFAPLEEVKEEMKAAKSKTQLIEI